MEFFRFSNSFFAHVHVHMFYCPHILPKTQEAKPLETRRNVKEWRKITMHPVDFFPFFTFDCSVDVDERGEAALRPPQRAAGGHGRDGADSGGAPRAARRRANLPRRRAEPAAQEHPQGLDEVVGTPGGGRGRGPAAADAGVAVERLGGRDGQGSAAELLADRVPAQAADPPPTGPRAHACGVRHRALLREPAAVARHLLCPDRLPLHHVALQSHPQTVGGGSCCYATNDC
jgi:hypothetical protein